MADEKQVAVVTGGSRGIGEGIVRRLCKDGYVVHSTYRSNEEHANAIAEDIKKNGGEVTFHHADISQEESAQNLIETVVTAEGRIDALVNNAGITRDGLIMRMSTQDWNDVIQTNLTGVFHLCKAVTRPMMRQRAGRIVNLGSIVGLTGNAGQVNYSAAKAGLVGLTKSMAKELASRNVLVNCVAPGYVDTDMTQKLTEEQRKAFTEFIPLSRSASVEEIAGVVSFFLSDDSSYITGQVINVDGGLAM